MQAKFILFAVVAALLSGITPRSGTASAQVEPRRIEITARRFSYSINEITLKKGQPVVLVLTSLDATHGLLIHDLNVDIKVKKGETKEAEFTPEQVGTFIGHCSVFCGAGHGSMMLTIHVVE